MLYGFLLTLYIINCFLLVFIILLQKSKSSLGLGGLGGGTQMLFGGSGGQDIFQKITWILGTIFMVGALLLSLMKSTEHKKFKYIAQNKITLPALPNVPVAPLSDDSATE
jgi:preprotein translocase subunit SecG